MYRESTDSAIKNSQSLQEALHMVLRPKQASTMAVACFVIVVFLL